MTFRCEDCAALVHYFNWYRTWEEQNDAPAYVCGNCYKIRLEHKPVLQKFRWVRFWISHRLGRERVEDHPPAWLKDYVLVITHWESDASTYVHKWNIWLRAWIWLAIIFKNKVYYPLLREYTYIPYVYAAKVEGEYVPGPLEVIRRHRNGEIRDRKPPTMRQRREYLQKWG